MVTHYRFRTPVPSHLLHLNSWLHPWLPSPPLLDSIKNLLHSIFPTSSALLNVLKTLSPLKIITNPSVTQHSLHFPFTRFTATWTPLHHSTQTVLTKLMNDFHISKSNNPFWFLTLWRILTFLLLYLLSVHFHHSLSPDSTSVSSIILSTSFMCSLIHLTVFLWVPHTWWALH